MVESTAARRSVDGAPAGNCLTRDDGIHLPGADSSQLTPDTYQREQVRFPQGQLVRERLIEWDQEHGRGETMKHTPGVRITGHAFELFEVLQLHSYKVLRPLLFGKRRPAVLSEVH